jgi:hypothetical protein
MSIHAPMLDKIREKVQGKPFTNPNDIDTVREPLSRPPTGMIQSDKRPRFNSIPQRLADQDCLVCARCWYVVEYRDADFA